MTDDPMPACARILASLPDALAAAVLAAACVIAVASVIAAATPTPRDDRMLGRLYRLLEILAFNFARAKDRPANRDGGRFRPD